MTVPWVDGTVGVVVADNGMVNGLARGYGERRSLEARMADIVTVCEAVCRLQDEL